MNRALDVAQIHYDKVVYSDIHTLTDERLGGEAELQKVICGASFLPKKVCLCIYFRENVLFSRKWV